MQVSTARLLVREFTWDDLDATYAYESDPLVVAQRCNGRATKAECAAYLGVHLAHQTAQPRVSYRLAISLPVTNDVIGWCGLKMTHPAHQEGE